MNEVSNPQHEPTNSAGAGSAPIGGHPETGMGPDPDQDLLLSDEELDEVYGGLSTNWEVDW